MENNIIVKSKNKSFVFDKDFIEKIPFFSLSVLNSETIDLPEEIDEELMEEFYNFYLLESKDELNDKNILFRYNNYPPEKIFKLIQFIDFLGKEEYLKFLENFIVLKIDGKKFEYLPLINNVELEEEERLFISKYLKTKDVTESEDVIL